MFIFIGILAMGLAYAWAKGFLDWIKPRVSKPVYQSHIPKEVYEKVSERYAIVKEEQWKMNNELSLSNQRSAMFKSEICEFLYVQNYGYIKTLSFSY